MSEELPIASSGFSSRAQERRTDCRLFTIKAVVISAALGAVLLARSIRSIPMPAGVVMHPDVGVELRYPARWYGRQLSVNAVQASSGRGSVTLWRLAWGEIQAMQARFPGGCLGAPPIRENPVAYLACSNSMDLEPGAETVRTILGGRPASMVVAPLTTQGFYAAPGGSWLPPGPGWSALVVASGPDLLFMTLKAPTEEALAAVWKDWLWMIGRVRVTSNEPAKPFRQGVQY